MLQISEQHAQALLNYLATKLYQEVYEAVMMLQSLQPVEKSDTTTTKK